MQNHRGSQQRRQERRENKRVARAPADRLGRAARRPRARAMVETSPMANMPSSAWERDVWGLGDG